MEAEYIGPYQSTFLTLYGTSFPHTLWVVVPWNVNYTNWSMNKSKKNNIGFVTMAWVTVQMVSQ